MATVEEATGVPQLRVPRWVEAADMSGSVKSKIEIASLTRVRREPEGPGQHYRIHQNRTTLRTTEDSNEQRKGQTGGKHRLSGVMSGKVDRQKAVALSDEYQDVFEELQLHGETEREVKGGESS